MNEELLNSLSTKDKAEFSDTLHELIKQTFEVEKEYKSLQLLMNNIIDSLPNAMWVLISDDGTVLIQNKASHSLNDILSIVDFNQEESELEYQNRFYLMKITFFDSHLIISATDITEHKRKERLAHMGQIAAHLAHEIRNPIGAVSVFASSLLKKVDTKTKPIVFEIKKSIWRVDRIIKTTLLFSKGIEPNMHIFDTEQLQDELDAAISNYTYTKDIDFNFNLPAMKIYADLELMSLVFQNLIFNAIDAIEEDDCEEGVIDFEFSQDDEFISIKVYDSGVCIANPERLFEAYETTKTKGNGLGLPLVKQIMEAHDGFIRLVEERKGFEIGLKKHLH